MIETLMHFVGYNMRQHINKALNTRCRALQNTINKYNAAALACNPPRTTLDWARVSHFNFLEEFTLLLEHRPEVLAQPWTKPEVRLAMSQHLRLKRAREEIERCNVQVRRLHTHIVDEEAHMQATVASLKAANNPIAPAVEEYCLRRSRMNGALLTRIGDTYALDGFTGIPTPGISKAPLYPRRPMTAATAGATTADEDTSDIEEPDDDDAEVVDGLVDFVGNLAA